MILDLPKFKCKIELDEEDYNYLINELKITSFSVNVDDYVTCTLHKIGKKSLSRLVLRYTGSLFVDHIDRNPLNNKKDNLRIVTQSQSNQNRKKLSSSSSKYKGVSIVKSALSNRFCVRLRINGKYTHIGNFQSERLAAIKYNEMAIKYHGEYACLNDIKESV